MSEAKPKSDNKEYAKKGFRFKLENSKILKGIVRTLASIIDETEFVVSPEEFTISAMDPSRICLLKLTMQDRDFDEFECERETKVGLNLDDLDKILSRSSKKDSIELNFEENNNKIKIVMEREGSSKKRTFSLTLLDIDMEEIPMDNLLAIEYPQEFRIDPDFMIEAIKDAEIYSEILKIKADETTGLLLESSGQIGEMSYSLGLDEFFKTDFRGTSKGQYSIVFLQAIMRIKKITEMLDIYLKDDHPLKMVFKLLEGGKLDYFLAPRVEDPDFSDEDMDEF